MQLARVVVGWLAVGIVFLAAGILAGRDAAAPAPRWLPFAEAVPFTLLAALWFASVGRGTWPLVFVLLAIVAEAPTRLRELARGGRPLRVAAAMLPGIGRMLVAALVLRWVL